MHINNENEQAEHEKNTKMYSLKRKGATRSVMELVETENFKGKPGTK